MVRRGEVEVLASLDGGPPRRVAVPSGGGREASCAELLMALSRTFGVTPARLKVSAGGRQVSESQRPCGAAVRGHLVQLRADPAAAEMWQIGPDGTAFSPACVGEVSDDVVSQLASTGSPAAVRGSVSRLYADAKQRAERHHDKLQARQRLEVVPRTIRVAPGRIEQQVERLFGDAQTRSARIAEKRRAKDTAERGRLSPSKRLTAEELAGVAKRLCDEAVQRRKQLDEDRQAKAAAPARARQGKAHYDPAKCTQWAADGARRLVERTKADLERRERTIRWRSRSCPQLNMDNVQRYDTLRKLVDTSAEDKPPLVTLPGAGQHPHQGANAFVPLRARGLWQRRLSEDVRLVWNPDREPDSARGRKLMPTGHLRERLAARSADGAKRLAVHTRAELERRERVLPYASPTRCWSPRRSWDTVHRHQLLQRLVDPTAETGSPRLLPSCEAKHDVATVATWKTVGARDVSRYQRASDTSMVFSPDRPAASPGRRWDPTQLDNLRRGTAASRAKQVAASPEKAAEQA
eukprot:TRINITY_DN8684_c0_g1_i1.p1 TRINITY_DN8684_c0_g1~~TRINITY_DN8684_c0_g1_i1.p1  ORF type:complete len:546 (+),score=169.17 TRINITY_DN8684_c0_g1_i1:75-1640(+)